jgi:hypothetical protein
VVLDRALLVADRAGFAKDKFNRCIS